jgi:hypothetical protein
MGVNWDSGVLFWKDHTPSADEQYTLSHLHPFVRRVELAAIGKNPAREAKLYVAFGLHTFTRAIEPGDRRNDLYRDNREARAFCRARYQRSFQLPKIIRTLETRRCEFARGRSGFINYVTVETTEGERYAAFFELRRLKTLGPGAIQLMVQSAYVLDWDKPAPGKGRIHFRALLGHVLRGTTPHVPP